MSDSIFQQPLLRRLQQSLSMYQYCGRAIQLVWSTHRRLTISLALLTIIAGLLPAWIAYLGKVIVDGVVMNHPPIALTHLSYEAIAVVLLAGTRQGQALCQSLLRVLLAQKVNRLILEKALTLTIAHFEDAEFYDKMTRARREASDRPLSLVQRTFGLVQDSLSLITYGGLLLKFSIWAVVMLLAAAIPAFIAETRFAGEAFRLARWRAPESREQAYLEALMTREDSAMEVKLYQLGELFLDRHQGIFDRLYRDDRNLTVRRSVWRYLLGLVSTLTFYGAYLWIVWAAIARTISIGDLTMYLVVFRQGQSTVSGILSSISSMYEDSLYLSNLYEYLEQPIPKVTGSALSGPDPDEGLYFENVSFAYPESQTLALTNVSFRIRPGEKLAIVGENGSGKTTLIKLLARLYTPTEGRIYLDGLDLQEWDPEILKQRISVIFQTFVRYQFTIGENIGAGDVARMEDQSRWQTAAEKGTARSLIESLEEQYHTRLGRWFKGGRELSGGQWQKIALSRAFMRSRADILILDEPTSAIDAEAEVQVFRHVREMTQNQMAILISHRFSTVRMADSILVLSGGKVMEQGTHDELLAMNGRYAKLFYLQAAGYQ